jgi:uncharacterized protein YoxC
LEHASLINDIAVGALVFFALALCGLLAAASTLLPQINRTLNAYEKLADTLETELGPTLQEVQKVVVGVGELKQIAGQRVADVSTKVEDVTGSLNKAASSAKHQSSVVGAGLWAGVRAYLEGKDHSHDHSTEHKGHDNPLPKAPQSSNKGL